MKPITESYVKQHLRQAAETLTPRRAEALWAQPVEKATGDEWYLDGVRPKKRRTGRTIGIFSSLAACLAVCFLSLYMVHFRVDATVYLDVNPSVTLQVNCSEKVIRARANNPDGEIILEGMELEHTDLTVAVNAVIGSMVRHGYLSEAQDVVLLSVSSGSAEKTEALRARLSGEIHDCLTSLIGSGTVLDQEVEPDDALEGLAESCGITPGKAALIRRVVEANPDMDFDTLASLSMQELTGCLAASGVDIRDYANQTGAPAEAFDRDDAPDNAEEPEDADIGETDEPEDAEPEEADVPETPEPEETDVPDGPEPEEADVPENPEPEEADVPETPEPEETDVPDGPEPEETDVPDGPEPEETDEPETLEPEEADEPENPEPEEADEPENPEPEEPPEDDAPEPGEEAPDEGGD